MPVWGEFLHIEEDGDTYEEAVTKATVKIMNLLEPGEQVLRRCPESLEVPTWCLARTEAHPSLGYNSVRAMCEFELIYPEDLETR